MRVLWRLASLALTEPLADQLGVRQPNQSRTLLLSSLCYGVLFTAALILCLGCIAPPREVQTLRALVRKYPCTPAARFRGNVRGAQLTVRERCALLSAARDAYQRSNNVMSLGQPRAETSSVLSADIINDPPIAWIVEFHFLGSRRVATVRLSQRDGTGQVTSTSVLPSGSGATF